MIREESHARVFVAPSASSFVGIARRRGPYSRGSAHARLWPSQDYGQLRRYRRRRSGRLVEVHRHERASVNLLSIGNAPSAILNVLVGGGGTATYDVINIVGGMQKPLVENDLVEPIDAAKLPNWGKDSYIQEFLKPGSPGFNFIGYKEKVYGVPTVLQGDSFAYLPEATGDLDSYGALFDPKWKGYVALEDNYTTAGQKTALYLKKSKLASIANPDDMTPAEIKTVVDFLVEKKKEGQFRTLWSSFEQAVNLLVSKEVKVLDCWEPMVFVAETKGVKAVYAQPKEGYLLWAMAAYLIKNPKRPPEKTKAAHELLDFMLGPWYAPRSRCYVAI